MLPLKQNLIPKNPVTRFAPSVTGWLHLGHVAHAAFVWGAARVCGARVVLRLDDHDRGRFRPEYETSILKDLEWLKLEPDDHRDPLYRQNEHGEYAAELTRLSSHYRIYACECTRAMIGKSSRRTASPRGYSGRCRERGLARGPGRGVRVVVEPGVEKFTDVLLGELQQDATRDGDPLLLDRTGGWTYHFSVVVDDIRQGVNLVIRGEDLLDSTGRQIRLARMLGRSTPPVYLHHPLMQDEHGNKLSKRDGALGVRELRANGMTPEELLGLAVHRLGLTAAPAPLAADELEGLFILTE